MWKAPDELHSTLKSLSKSRGDKAKNRGRGSSVVPSLSEVFGDNPPIPKRKPTPLQLRVGQFMRKSQGKFPLAELGDVLGDSGAKVFGSNVTLTNKGGTRYTLGSFMRNVDPDSLLGELLTKLGRTDLLEEVINISPWGLTKKQLEPTVRHEFRHSALAKLRDEAGTFHLDLPRLEFASSVNEQGTLTSKPSRLREEDLVRLLDAVTDISLIKETQGYFRKVRKPRIFIPVDKMLKSTTIRGALMLLQKRADLFLQSKGAPPSLIHFPSDEELYNMIRRGKSIHDD